MNKKLSSFLLAMLLVLTSVLAACGGTEESKTESKATESQAESKEESKEESKADESKQESKADESKQESKADESKQESVAPVAKNLALTSTVTSTYTLPLDILNPKNGLSAYYDETNKKAIYPIENIIDGNPMAVASTHCRYHWTQDGYILFDLGAEYTLTGYGIYNYEWPYQWCLNEEWTVYASTDGTNFTKVRSDKIDTSEFTQSVKYATDVKGGKPDGGDFDQPVNARYIKLVIDKVFVGAGDNTRTGTELSEKGANGGTEADVRIYEFEIYGYDK